MNIDHFDDVQALKARRDKVLAMLKAVREGSFSTLTVWRNGEKYEALEVVPKHMILQALADGAGDALASVDKELLKFGVSGPKFDPDAGRTAESYRRDMNMYVNAWLRELGGKVLPRWHFIDALVATTARLREKAAEAEMERAERVKLDNILREKDVAMGVLFARLREHNIPTGDLIP